MSTSSESLSISSSLSETRSESGRVIYNSSHCVDVSMNNGSSYLQRNVLFTVNSLDRALKIKMRDASDYAFNYTALIDWVSFDRMKREQSLDIPFEEFQPQIVELLRQTASKQMLMKIETLDSQAKIIFYEKSRIKALIFLTIDLILTNSKELADEMAHSITQLKDLNRTVSTQLSLTKSQLRDTELVLRNALATNGHIEKQFRKDLDLVLQTFLTHLCKTEASITLEITKLTKRHQKLLKDIENVRKENVSKHESNRQLLQSMQNLQVEADTNKRLIENFKCEIQRLNNQKAAEDHKCADLTQKVTVKERELHCLQNQMTELRRDIQDATMIIAQKTKTNDEIGKDLIQANQVIVNFNTRYDVLLNETDELKEKLHFKDNIIKEQLTEMQRINGDFEQYRATFNPEEIKQLHCELFHARQKIEELQKQNREAVKLNGLLTNKLSSVDLPNGWKK